MFACEVARHTTIHIVYDVLIFGTLQYSTVLCSWRFQISHFLLYHLDLILNYVILAHVFISQAQTLFCFYQAFEGFTRILAQQMVSIILN